MLRGAAKDLKQRLPRLIVEQIVKVGAPATEVARQARSIRADLVVMGRGRGRPLREFFLGSTAERVIRHGVTPVLTVRLQPRGRYSRAVLAMEFDRAASDAVSSLLSLLTPPRPLVVVVHAYDAPFLIYPSASVDAARDHRELYRRKAVDGLVELLAKGVAGASIPPHEAPRWRIQARYGSPRAAIEKAVRESGADLLVLGTRAHGGVATAFLGTVAGDVLRKVPCDVLVVPPGRGITPT